MNTEGAVNDELFSFVLVLLLVIDLLSFRLRLRSRAREKPRTAERLGALNYYPANAVKADIPFPFGNGRMTAA